MNKIKYSFSMVIKFITKNYFLRVYKVNYVFGDFNPKKEGPFFLVGNHVLLLDAFFSNFAIKGYALPVTNSFVFTNPLNKFALTNFTDSIVKRKGQSDIQTIKEIRRHIKDGRPIAVYPEGNTSYYGVTSESVYATAKLLKLQKIDVVCSKTKGGYFAKPRWREHRIKHPYIEIEMFLLFTSKEIEMLSVDDIYKKMIDSYYQNDYEWNRIEKHKYVGKNRLEGSHRVIYFCPECHSINTISSKGDTIYCDKCGMLGNVNDYGFIENTKFDNFVDWGEAQEAFLAKNLEIEFNVQVEIYKVDLVKFIKTSIGAANLLYTYGKFQLNGSSVDLKFIIKDIKGEAYTEANQFSFDYMDETYIFVSEKPKLLLDITRFNKEE